MKINRELAALILAAIGIPAIYFGGFFFFIVFSGMVAMQPGNSAACSAHWISSLLQY
jgi:hypothetical protein